MKRFPLVIAGTLVMLTICCGREERPLPVQNLNIKMKVGVVLRSGDVKNVARQNFIISKVDIVSLWENSKNSIDKELIEKEFVAKMGYMAKISEYEAGIKSLKDAEKQMTNSINASLAPVQKKLREHAEITYQEGLPLGVGDKFLGFRVEPSDIALFKESITKQYTKTIGSNISPEARQFLSSRMIDLNMIDVPVLNPEKARKAMSDINNLVTELESYKQSFRQTVANECEARAKISYLGKLKESHLIVVKTDLNGEASVTLQKGGHFIFGYAEIGDNFIAWNYSVDIAKDGQYIELSNDNAYSFDRNTVSKLLELLTENPT